MASWFTQKSYNKWTEIEKLWLAPIHPNNLLWSANAEVAPDRLLGPMSLLQRTWRTLAQSHKLTSEKSPLTSFVCNPKVPDSLTYQMSHPWSSRNLFHFGTPEHVNYCLFLIYRPNTNCRDRHSVGTYKFDIMH